MYNICLTVDNMDKHQKLY